MSMRLSYNHNRSYVVRLARRVSTGEVYPYPCAGRQRERIVIGF